MPGPLTWRREKDGASATVVPPGELVRVQVPGAVPAGEGVDVASLPERALARLIYRLSGGRWTTYQTTLYPDVGASPSAGPGVLSQTWSAGKLGLKPAATRYLPQLEDFSPCALLHVQTGVVINREGASGGLTIDPVAVAGALGGAPVQSPLQINANSGRTTMTYEVYAPRDPTVELRVMTPSAAAGENVHAYVEAYLPHVAEEHEVAADDLWGMFQEEYGSYLEDSARLGAEVNRPIVNVPAGEPVGFNVDFYPSREGRSMLAIAALDVESQELLSVSALSPLTFSTPDSGTLDV